MRRILGMLAPLAALVVLAGCGSDGSTGSDAPPTSPATASPTTGAITPVSATVVPGPNSVRGRSEGVATELTDEAAVTTYAGTLVGPLRMKVKQAALPLLGKGGTLYAQTIFDGCGTPPVDSLSVTKRASGEVVISTSYHDAPKIACFVGVRSVALVVLP